MVSKLPSSHLWLTTPYNLGALRALPLLFFDLPVTEPNQPRFCACAGRELSGLDLSQDMLVSSGAKVEPRYLVDHALEHGSPVGTNTHAPPRGGSLHAGSFYIRSENLRRGAIYSFAQAELPSPLNLDR